LLDTIPPQEDKDLLVGFKHSDDAGVYKISEQQALVTTADFITPPVDDPYVYGQIAAANSLSDIYAMGGKPIICLNLVCFPTDKLDPSILAEIIRGAHSKIIEAGASLVGGHSVDDEEPKFGLSVTGLVHPGAYWANSGAMPGDRLILTKPIGSGVLFNANLKDAVSDAAMNACIDFAVELNRTAAEVFAGFDIHAATDITGFGLAGHALEMARASDVTINIETNQVPILDEARLMYQRGFTTGSNDSNQAMVAEYCNFENLSGTRLALMLDPQTNGGLLVSVPEDQAGSIIDALTDKGISSASIIGEVRGYDGKFSVRFLA